MFVRGIVLFYIQTLHMKVRGIVAKEGNRLFTFTTFPNTFFHDCRLKPFDSSQNNLLLRNVS